MDSFYPLITNDPERKREYTLKITKNKLENVFGKESNNEQFNL